MPPAPPLPEDSPLPAPPEVPTPAPEPMGPARPAAPVGPEPRPAAPVAPPGIAELKPQALAATAKPSTTTALRFIEQRSSHDSVPPSA